MKISKHAAWRHVVAVLCLLAGAFVAPQVLAHDTPQPIANTEGGSGVVSVSTGYGHSCGLKSDGSVACWGTNGYGQLNGAPSSTDRSTSLPGP